MQNRTSNLGVPSYFCYFTDFLFEAGSFTMGPTKIEKVPYCQVSIRVTRVCNIYQVLSSFPQYLQPIFKKMFLQGIFRRWRRHGRRGLPSSYRVSPRCARDKPKVLDHRCWMVFFFKKKGLTSSSLLIHRRPSVTDKRFIWTEKQKRERERKETKMAANGGENNETFAFRVFFFLCVRVCVCVCVQRFSFRLRSEIASSLCKVDAFLFFFPLRMRPQSLTLQQSQSSVSHGGKKKQKIKQTRSKRYSKDTRDRAKAPPLPTHKKAWEWLRWRTGLEWRRFFFKFCLFLPVFFSLFERWHAGKLGCHSFQV